MSVFCWQESVFRFRPGIIPAYRQMFYQFCDIEIPEIQDLLHKNDGNVSHVSGKILYSVLKIFPASVRRIILFSDLRFYFCRYFCR